MNKRIWLVLLFAVFMVAEVSALGVTPGRNVVDFEPGEEKEFSFSVINSEKKDVNLVLLVQGELNQSIELSEVSFGMSADEESREIRYKVRVPEGLGPGKHSAEIVIIQIPSESETSEAFVGATVGVALQVQINVPFPGKYVEADLNIIGPGSDGKVTFVIPIVSRGDLDIARARGVIDIYTKLNEKVATIETNEVFVPSGSRKEAVAEWNSAEFPPGPYRAVATVLYDESTLTLEKEFNIGSKLLEVKGIEVNDFSLGEIAKFEILVESKWSETISGAYAQMHVFNDEGEVMADYKSSTYDIPPLESVLMTAFWDTEGVSEGTYDSSLFLRYGSKSQEENLRLEISDNEINVVGVGFVISRENSRTGDGNETVVILMVAVAVLVLINLVWFLIVRKKIIKGSVSSEKDL